MTNRKSFTAPFWCLLLIIIFQTLSLIPYYRAVQKFIELNRDNPLASPQIETGFMVEVGVTVLLLAEWVVYWMLRKRIKNRSAALVNISCLMMSFVIVPFVSRILVSSMTLQEMVRYKNGQSIVTLSLFVAGQIAFIYLLTKGLYSRKEKIPLPVEEQHLLEDFADKP